MVKGKGRYKYSQIRRQMTMQAACMGEELRPWMKALALWYVGQVKRPKVEEVAVEARRLTNQPVSKNAISRLLVNPAFQAFLGQCEEEVTTRAKAYAETKLQGAVEKHFDAIDDLHKERRWDQLVKYTNPLMERVWPTTEGPRTPAQIIQINIGGKFAQDHVKSYQPILAETVVEEAVVE